MTGVYALMASLSKNVLDGIDLNIFGFVLNEAENVEKLHFQLVGAINTH